MISWRQAEAAQAAEEAVAVGMDHDGQETSTVVKAIAATEAAEGHSGMQYAAAAPTELDTRSSYFPTACRKPKNVSPSGPGFGTSSFSLCQL